MTWEKKRITIVTKAYPEPSAKYGDVACTAGITDKGEWIRLYPIDMRHFIGRNKISKFDIIEAEIKRDNDKLGRKESHKVRPDSIRVIDKSLTISKRDWPRRNSIILPKLNESVQALRDAYNEDKTSLGIVRPTEILDFIKTEELEIFEIDSWSFTINLDGTVIPKVTKIPHIFKYHFKCRCCEEGEHIMQCEDWELFQAYLGFGHHYRDVDTLWEKLRDRFYIRMLKERNLHFLMGMYSQYPTWFIIGLYYPPK